MGRTPLIVFVLLAPFLTHAQSPTFAHDIAPIIFRNCTPCHRPGEPAPFALLTYEDVRKRAAQISDVTRKRYMPPWLPDDSSQFANERRLTPADIRLISEWAAAGAPQGPAETPPAPKFTTGWQLGQPDLILQAATPHTAPAAGPDAFWNFVFRTDLAKPRYVRAVEIRPSDQRTIHHANLLIDRAGPMRRRASDAGFPGMDLAIVRSPFDPDGHFLFYKPGGTPNVEPDGLSWRLNPGDELVLNTHIHPSGKPEQLRPTIGLYFTDKAPTQFPLLIQLEHDSALAIVPGRADFIVSDDFRLPIDADILAVYPHAHYLGKLLEGYAMLPTGERRELIRIPEWDLNWQSVYRYREPVFLPAGSIISMRYHYDNSAANIRNPNHPPKLVVSGNQSTDEMGHLWLQVLPRGNRDRRLELQEAVMRHRLEKYPDDFEAQFNLGAVMLARLDVSRAAGMLEAAVRIDPRRPEAHNMLGAALARLGRTAEATTQFRTALQLWPDFTNARFNLANALMKSGNYEEALADYRKVVATYPNDTVAKDRLAAALRARADQLAAAGKTVEAESLRRELVAIH